MKKFRGITIKRKDYTVPMTKKEQEEAKKRNVEEFRFPKAFNIRISNAIVPSHRMCNEV